MKTLTNKEIIKIINHCNYTECDYCENECPLFKERLYYYTGDHLEGNVLKKKGE